MRIQLDDFPCEVVLERRGARGISMRMVAAEAGRFGVVTVEAGDPLAQISCSPQAWIAEPDEVCIKAYAENQGIVPLLVSQGVVKAPHIHLDLRGGATIGPRRVSGPDEADAYVAVCRLTATALAEIERPAVEDVHE